MNKTARLILLLLGLLASVSVFAQDNFDYQLSSVEVLTQKSVQKELGVSEQQRAAMNKFADAHRAKLKAYYTKVQKAGGTVDSAKLTGYYQDLRKGVLKQLSASQLKRLREISLQRFGFSALGDPAVGQKVGLSPSEQKKMQAILTKGLNGAKQVQVNAINKATAKLEKVKPKSAAEQAKLQDDATKLAESAMQEVSPQVDRITADTRQKAMGLLTPQQKANWQALLGKPFRG